MRAISAAVIVASIFGLAIISVFQYSNLNNLRTQLNLQNNQIELLEQRVDVLSLNPQTPKKMERRPLAHQDLGVESGLEPSSLSPDGTLGRSHAGNDVLEAIEEYGSEERMRFRALLEEEQDRMRQEHRDRRIQARLKAGREGLEQLKLDAKLSDDQADFVLKLWEAEQKQIQDLFSKARETMNIQSARVEVRALRDDNDSRIADELADEQYQKYQEFRNNDRPRRP